MRIFVPPITFIVVIVIVIAVNTKSPSSSACLTLYWQNQPIPPSIIDGFLESREEKVIEDPQPNKMRISLTWQNM